MTFADTLKSDTYSIKLSKGADMNLIDKLYGLQFEKAKKRYTDAYGEMDFNIVVKFDKVVVNVKNRRETYNDVFAAYENNQIILFKENRLFGSRTDRIIDISNIDDIEIKKHYLGEILSLLGSSTSIHFHNPEYGEYNTLRKLLLEKVGRRAPKDTDIRKLRNRRIAIKFSKLATKPIRSINPMVLIGITIGIPNIMEAKEFYDEYEEDIGHLIDKAKKYIPFPFNLMV